MAIQNFLSGGFYGKLGDVVGQRWHNKRIIRTHVIPFNPRTEKQQANRELFALATALAQEAYNINKGSPLWDTSKMGQFSLMVGTAKRRLQKGMSPAEALPLFPDGHDPSVILSNPTANWTAWPSKVTISDNSFTFTQTRQMEVILQVYDVWNLQPDFLHFIITVPAGSTFSYTFDIDNRYSIPAGSNIQAVSLNDEQFAGQSIQLLTFLITQPSKPTLQVKVPSPAVVYAPDWHELTIANMPKINEEEVDFFIYIWDNDNKSWVTYNFIWGTWPIWSTTWRAGYEPNEPFYSRPGTHIVAGNFTVERDSANFYFHWDRFDFSAP